MKIKKITIDNHGYIKCRSRFYISDDGLEGKFSFGNGINILHGEIDSGVWAISYLLSMYRYRPKDFILFEKKEVIINDIIAMSLDEFSKYSCYMEENYPLFSKKDSVKKMVTRSIKRNNLDYTPDEIRELFCMSEHRYERPLHCVGHEVFKAMAAIGYCNKKQVYCFPWLSQMRFDVYQNHLKWLLDIMEQLDLIVILPIGY